MKHVMIIALLTSFTAAGAHASCKATVEEAGLEYARRLNDSANLVGAKLVSSKGAARHYLVEYFTSYSDDAATYDFPAEYLLVTAVGDQYACTVKNIKKK